jgi:hypothetical protein
MATGSGTSLGLTGGAGAAKTSGFGSRLSPFGQSQAQKAAEPQDELLQRLHRIRDAYNPDSTSYRFRALVYNTVTEAAANSGSVMGVSGGIKRPRCVGEAEWSEAIAAAPPAVDPRDRMFPCFLMGFGDLVRRAKQQSDVIAQMRLKLGQLRRRIADLFTAFQDDVAQELLLRNRNADIQAMLMDYVQAEELHALKDHAFCSEEAAMLDDLEQLEAGINDPKHYISALNTLKLRAQFSLVGAPVPATACPALPPDALGKFREILSMNTDALKELVKSAKLLASQADDLWQSHENADE